MPLTLTPPELELIRRGLYSVRTSDPEEIEALKSLRIKIDAAIGPK